MTSSLPLLCDEPNKFLHSSTGSVLNKTEFTQSCVPNKYKVICFGYSSIILLN